MKAINADEQDPADSEDRRGLSFHAVFLKGDD